MFDHIYKMKIKMKVKFICHKITNYSNKLVATQSSRTDLLNNGSSTQDLAETKPNRTHLTPGNTT